MNSSKVIPLPYDVERLQPDGVTLETTTAAVVDGVACGEVEALFVLMVNGERRVTGGWAGLNDSGTAAIMAVHLRKMAANIERWVAAATLYEPVGGDED